MRVEQSKRLPRISERTQFLPEFRVCCKLKTIPPRSSQYLRPEVAQESDRASDGNTVHRSRLLRAVWSGAGAGPEARRARAGGGPQHSRSRTPWYNRIQRSAARPRVCSRGRGSTWDRTRGGWTAEAARSGRARDAWCGAARRGHARSSGGSLRIESISAGRMEEMKKTYTDGADGWPDRTESQPWQCWYSVSRVGASSTLRTASGRCGGDDYRSRVIYFPDACRSFWKMHPYALVLQ